MSLRGEILEQPEVAARFLRRAPEVVGPLVVVSDADEALALAPWPLRLTPGTPEWLGLSCRSSWGSYALYLTRARGHDPEVPRNLNKVTRTR